MGHWLAPLGSAKTLGTVKRFDARYWTVDFPRPMMASLVTTGPQALRVDLLFYRKNDLAGLIWEAEDRWDHSLLRYETARDFRRCRLSFRWRSEGILALDAINGPTLTLEGRDAAGAARTWFVRLWNYANGDPWDARVDLDFGALAAGWEGDDPVWAGDLDRLFISLPPTGYSTDDAPLAEAVAGSAELTEIACDGSGSVLSIGDVIVPEHGMRAATGYDDLYHLSPARILRNILQLGYREVINHYVGMSHYFRLGTDLRAVNGLNGPCVAWHRDFLERAEALGYEIILSLSYELLAEHCPEGWMQRYANGDPALTAWEPPSALLSPANAEAMAWLQGIARGFVALALAAGQAVRFQIGEPWWWTAADGRICIYDEAAIAAFAPVSIPDVRVSLDAGQKAALDAAGAVLAASTTALCAAVREEAPEAECLLLVYLPTLLAESEVQRANLPMAWAAPAFDILQLEDYEWVTAQQLGKSRAGLAAAGARLGYSPQQQHYLSGFVASADDRPQWTAIMDAAQSARSRGVAEVFLWALPQVLRDGLVFFEEGAETLDAFEDVRFPVALGRDASVVPAFSTAVATSASGFEQRNAEWADARLSFDAGPGVRGLPELHELIAFFRARRGAAIGFRFEDPFDNSSNGMIGEPGTTDQFIGTGDGASTDFALIKRYGDQERRITRPVAGTVRVAVDGVERVGGWAMGDLGVVSFEVAPDDGAEIFAGFRFDVPVRFAEDRLDLSRATFAAGEIPSVPLIEVRE